MEDHPSAHEIEQNRTNLDLAQQIAELRGVVVEGFTGVHRRQDITNGRIAKVEGRVDALEIAEADSIGRRKGVWKFWLVLSAVLGLVIGACTIVALSGCWGLICK